MTNWEKRAHEVENVYGGYVDWEERFFNCPECEEPIYEADWEGDFVENELCPVCGFNGEDDFEEDVDEGGFNPYMGCYDYDC